MDSSHYTSHYTSHLFHINKPIYETYAKPTVKDVMLDNSLLTGSLFGLAFAHLFLAVNYASDGRGGSAMFSLLSFTAVVGIAVYLRHDLAGKIAAERTYRTSCLANVWFDHNLRPTVFKQTGYMIVSNGDRVISGRNGDFFLAIDPDQKQTTIELVGLRENDLTTKIPGTSGYTVNPEGVYLRVV